jgi:hypothetical protein
MRLDSQSKEVTAFLPPFVGQCQKVHLIVRQLSAPGNRGGVCPLAPPCISSSDSQFTPPESYSELIRVKPFVSSPASVYSSAYRPRHARSAARHTADGIT